LAKVGIGKGSQTLGYQQGWNVIRRFLEDYPAIGCGLFDGSAGIALVLLTCINAGLVEPVSENITTIRHCLSLQAITPDLATGMAGQGMVTLRCASHFKDDWWTRYAGQLVQRIIGRQRRDGTWSERHGLAYGTAGIAYFLTEYLLHNNSEGTKEIGQAKISVEKALRLIIKKVKKPTAGLQRPDLSFCSGRPGIILALLKGYEVFRDPEAKELAERLLLAYPARLVSRDLTQSEGLTGLGEVYLEAARVIPCPEWQERADWIARQLFRRALPGEKNTCYWMVDNNTHPTAELMKGNGGVIYFLLRYLYPETFLHPCLYA
jgi:lantibiotic modifying enzyme